MTIVRLLLAAPLERRTWREYAYLAATLLPAIPGFVLAVVGIAASAYSLVGIGLPLLLLALFAARWIPLGFRAPARVLLGWQWDLPRRPRRTGVARRAVGIFADRAAWRHWSTAWPASPHARGAHASTVAIGLGVLAVTYPAWWFVTRGVFDVGNWGDTWLLAAQGAAALLAFPWLARLTVAVDRALVLALLAPSADQARVSHSSQAAR